MNAAWGATVRAGSLILALVLLAAVTTRADVAQVLAQRIHFNTFGGNPISMAAGIAVLDAIEEDGLQENCKVLGAHFKARMAELAKSHRLIGDVRGKGLMLGVELVRDRATKEPAAQEAKDIMEEMREMGIKTTPGSLDEALTALEQDHAFLTQGEVFTEDLIDTWISYKREKELDPIRLRPHPHEFYLYYDN